MSILPICITGEPVLHRVADPVDSFDSELSDLVADMIETMHAAPGVGIGLPIAEFEGGLARADLADLVEASSDEAEAMLALPSFDELHVGYKDRSCLTDQAGEALICPAKNGMFRPIAVAGGRLVAVRAPGSQVVSADGCGTYEESARRAFGDWEKWLSETQR